MPLATLTKPHAWQPCLVCMCVLKLTSQPYDKPIATPHCTYPYSPLHPCPPPWPYSYPITLTMRDSLAFPHSVTQPPRGGTGALPRSTQAVP